MSLYHCEVDEERLLDVLTALLVGGVIVCLAGLIIRPEWFYIPATGLGIIFTMIAVLDS